MKKTFTLLAIASLLTTVSFAQNGAYRDNDWNNQGHEAVVNSGRDWNGNDRGRDGYFFSAKEKDMELFSINREYDHRIESVRHRFFMGRERKEQVICSLEAQRDAAIHSVMARFNDRRNLYDGRDNWHNDHDKRNNW